MHKSILCTRNVAAEKCLPMNLIAEVRRWGCSRVETQKSTLCKNNQAMTEAEWESCGTGTSLVHALLVKSGHGPNQRQQGPAQASR
jgi:hypothetical protein